MSRSEVELEDVSDSRAPQLIDQLVVLWERSVRATHLFLTSDDVLDIKKYVPHALAEVETLVIVKDDSVPVAFMGVQSGSLEMLFVDDSRRGEGVGRKLLNFAIKECNVSEMTVNEQNPLAVGFYKRIRFEVFDRGELDDQGRPFPLLRMRLPSAV